MTKTLHRCLPALAAALLLSAPAAAQWSPPNACDQEPDRMQAGLCLDRALQAADARLNAAYAQAQAAIRANQDSSPADRTAWLRTLRDAQRAWIAFRDIDCGELTSREWLGGTGANTASAACLLEKTERRVRELAERYRSR